MMIEPFISAEHVQVAYKCASAVKTVLDDITIGIARGEFVCLLGETGCGKSTFLRLVLGEERPTNGSIRMEGDEVRGLSSKRGYVPQRYALFPDRSALENVTFGPKTSEFGLFGRLTPRFWKRRHEIRGEALRLLREVGLTEHDAAKYPYQLSGGMQQRVAIAQALIMNPGVLLMDEAFSALDPGTRGAMQSMIRRLWADHRTTILFVTHNIQEAVQLGSRIIVLARPDACELSTGSRVALDMELANDGDPDGEFADSQTGREAVEYITRVCRSNAVSRSMQTMLAAG